MKILDKIRHLTLAANTSKSEPAKRYLPYDLKAVSRTRQDIQSWNQALRLAQSDNPKNYKLQLLYDEISNDALLSSQIQNRKQQLFTSSFSLKNAKGEIDEEQTRILKNSPIYRQLTMAVLDSLYYGYSLVELGLVKNTKGELQPHLTTLPRTNIVPQKGLFFKDYSKDDATAYRNMPEFGTWVLEFNSTDLGLLNKAVSHVLFKRFAQSCWSELCEIYGIPPRVLKTNTQDANMLRRGEQMMKDMGSAAWFIIDQSEKFEWANGVVTNGDVYKNLIKLCNNELSMLVSGAVIGQDTENGNRSKEQSSQELLWQLVLADMEQVEQYWNNTIIPALVAIGFLKGELYFEFDPQEDTKQLFDMTAKLLNHYTVPVDFIAKKFGIEVAEKITADKKNKKKLKLEANFFD